MRGSAEGYWLDELSQQRGVLNARLDELAEVLDDPAARLESRRLLRRNLELIDQTIAELAGYARRSGLPPPLEAQHLARMLHKKFDRPEEDDS